MKYCIFVTFAALTISGCAMDERGAGLDEQAEVTYVDEDAEPQVYAAMMDDEGYPLPEEELADGEFLDKADQYLDYNELYPYSGGLFGVSYNKVFGHATCKNGRVRKSSNVYKENGTGWCAGVRWFTDIKTDCRLLVHIGASAFQGGECRVLIYSQDP